MFRHTCLITRFYAWCCESITIWYYADEAPYAIIITILWYYYDYYRRRAPMLRWWELMIYDYRLPMLRHDDAYAERWWRFYYYYDKMPIIILHDIRLAPFYAIFIPMPLLLYAIVCRCHVISIAIRRDYFFSIDIAPAPIDALGAIWLRLPLLLRCCWCARYDARCRCYMRYDMRWWYCRCYFTFRHFFIHDIWYYALLLRDVRSLLRAPLWAAVSYWVIIMSPWLQICVDIVLPCSCYRAMLRLLCVIDIIEMRYCL